jgi:hypothetical protein
VEIEMKSWYYETGNVQECFSEVPASPDGKSRFNLNTQRGGKYKNIYYLLGPELG